MRRGYWRTLVRQLRDKLVAGMCVIEMPDATVVIAKVEADFDANIEQLDQVLLARDAHGNSIVLDVAGSTVCLMNEDGSKRILAADLQAFVDSLRSAGPIGLSMGDAMDVPLDLPLPRRGICDD